MEIIKSCVRDNNYIISINQNRQENQEFIDEYNIRSDKQKRILLELNVEDFCHSLNNTNEGYEHEILYVFAPQVQLYDAEGAKVTVDVYTKFNILDANERIIVISFHKLNRPIDYLFR